MRPGRPSWPARPTCSPSSVVFLPDRRTGACPMRAPLCRATSSLPACLSSPSSLWMIRTTPRDAPYPSHSPQSSPSSGSFSLSSPTAPESAAACHRGHRPPLALPLHPEAPPPRSVASPPSCASPDAPWSRRRRLHHLRPPWISVAARRRQRLPRARRRLFRSPVSPPASVPPPLLPPRAL